MQHVARNRFKRRISDDTYKAGMQVLEKQRVDATEYTKEQICGKFGEMLEDIYKADKRLCERMEKEQIENEEFVKSMLKTLDDISDAGLTEKTEQDIFSLIAKVLRLEPEDTKWVMEIWRDSKSD